MVIFFFFFCVCVDSLFFFLYTGQYKYIPK